ncbi:cytoplasmic polyadenylation element-binding protein isoform X1 [Halyomorpha halys]|uniref:cytoplasmic polyadenylation element-binding protein isoform X1 n=2 Tax=Halyomorpha halys TaxID=286706 RepID=UPI0006D4C97A|nr:cytoplasmic polyadenylation element-binding protein isoform X1 [Halyomorpha halys]XP_014280279.1 cytoplasmic polyadenylation element-binding protein isoform X1 [Halyomorpha halys]
MPSLPQQMQNRRDEGPSWLQAPSPFNTPPPTGDSVESISELLHVNMPIAARTGWDHAHFLHQQARQNQEYYTWNQGSSPFDNTPPPQGDSIDSISELLSLNMPRGSLLGNTNPLGTTTFNVTPSIEANSSYQGQAGRFNCYPNRYEPQSMSTPRKTPRPLDLTPPSPFSQVTPICPPQQLGSPPFNSSRSSPEDSGIYHSNVQSDLTKSSNEQNNNSNVSGMFCPSTDQEMANIQNLFALRRESDIMNKIIEHTSRLLLAAVNSPEIKSDEPPQFSQSQDKISRYLPPLTGSQREAAICTWTGQLPARIHTNPTYSCKVFLGGVPWDITEGILVQAFSKFGTIKIEWPGKDMPNQPKGYCYIIFEAEKKVKALLDCCIHDFSKGGNWYYKISSRKMKSKEVQVIPWAVSDSNYAQVSQKLDPQKTVFVGALHGMINARALAKIMNDLFGGVIYAGLDTDKYKYPIGSARVTFNNHRSYMKAVVAAFIEIKTSQFTKKVQVNPYLEDSPCSSCSVQQGPYFCREMVCFRYYCRGCWALQHSTRAMRSHQYISRNSKSSNISPTAHVL